MVIVNIIFESIADQSFWIWHAFFGLAGGNNDIHVLDNWSNIKSFWSSKELLNLFSNY
jgi:hypothetical protein